MNFRQTVSCLLLVFVAASAYASLSPQYVDWGKSAVQHLMTRDEAKRWKEVKTDEEAQAFIDLFWARRDPTPRSPANEFKDGIEQRIKVADERFGQGKTKGSMTDRGKVFILVGAPTRIARTGEGGVPAIQRPNRIDNPQEATETWYYSEDRVPPFAGVSDFTIVFVDEHGLNQFRMGRATKVEANSLLQKAVGYFLVSPELTEVPKMAAAPAPAPAPAPAAAAAPMTSFATQALASAVEQFIAAQKNPYKDLHVTYGEYITSDGAHFVPVQVYVSKSSGIDAAQPLTFFARVDDAAGKTVAVVEEPAKLVESKGDWYYDKSLTIPAGNYVAYIGLANSGTPVAMSKSELKVAGLTKDAPSVSTMIISNNLFALPQAQNPTDPFAFGGLKVVPKGDRAFTKSDELWYFIEVRNPSLNESGQPQFEAKIEIEGTAGGKKVKLGGAPKPVQLTEIKGVPGHWGVGESFVLDRLEPGDYTLKVRLMDQVKQQAYTFAEPFKMVQ